ncbi:MAG TPA: thiamine pyrophosphate-dependent enzyme [Verrucomicrobiae bacterium]|jgi:thiamine pyrophosphate-dependent acetolactate synthase large subunit-like protein|nr:thiamine pyrophosphate-dependent enzyme [Verrucomicrobiae bacterium]
MANGFDRRSFLKGAALTAAAIGTQFAQAIPARAEGGEEETAGAAAKDKAIKRPGSDFMVDVIKATGIEYIASNPGSSFRSLHESIVNYGGNKKPEFLTCMHEESSVAMAHGYAKAAGKPMGMLAHGTVGLQHATMAVYNAWCDRVPILMFAGNFLDADKRRPGVEWYHCVQDPAAIHRDFTKWDDQPVSLQHFAESVMRAYKIATLPPMGPVLITADGDLAEEPVRDEKRLKIPKLTMSIPSQGDSGAVAEAAKLLIAAEHPVILADRAARSQEGIKRLVELAEALNAPVVDLGGRMNFPTTHFLNRSNDKRAVVQEADVVLMLEVADPWGQFNSISDPHHEYRRLAKPDVKIIHISVAEGLTKSNYQDMQRFMPVDLAIFGDAQATLPVLTERVKSGLGSNQRVAIGDRAKKLQTDYRRMKDRARAAAAVGWDVTPVSTARLSTHLWNVIKKEEKWCVAVSGMQWNKNLWPATEYYNFIGSSGGSGVGYGAPAAVGAALANRDKGIFTMTIQNDGDLMYGPGVLWTAAHHKIPILIVMHNNRAYHQEVMHLQKMAGLHNRAMDRAGIGTTIENPNIDFAKLASSLGLMSEGPITDPAKVEPAIQRAYAAVKRGEPALVDVVTQGR